MRYRGNKTTGGRVRRRNKREVIRNKREVIVDDQAPFSTEDLPVEEPQKKNKKEGRVKK